MRRRVRLEAADRVEELAVIAKQIVLDMRGDPDDRASQEDADLTAYGRVYWLRTQLGYVVASLGQPGTPPSWVRKLVKSEYEKSEDETSADEGKK
jgi:hypothetical protein